MKKVIVMIITGILFLNTLIIFSSSGNASGNTIYVDDGNTAGPWDGSITHPFETIQDGIDASTEGDTIYVYSGQYMLYLLDKSITLEGQNKFNTIITNSFSITKNYASIKTFTLGTTNFALRINASNTNVFQNVINGYLSITGGSGNVIQENTFSSALNIDLRNCGDAAITNNNFQNNEVGVSHQPIVIQDCSNNIVISGNTLEDVDYGISISRTNEVSISGNTITINNNYAEMGIVLSSSSGNTIKENKIQDIPQQGYGIKLTESSNNNVIFQNTFNTESKTSSLAYDDENNQWYNPNTLKGNYWDNYRGQDSNGDGIGDIPYEISGGNNKDMYPLGHFNNPPAKPTNPSPYNGAANVKIPGNFLTLKIDVSDPDGDKQKVVFYDAFDNSIIRGSFTIVNSGEAASEGWLNLKYNTTYTWYVIANDTPYGGYGLETKSDIFSFTTEGEPKENNTINNETNEQEKINPVAFINGPEIGYVNVTYTYNASKSYTSNGFIVSYEWIFGDGHSTNEVSPIQNWEYSKPGNYTLTLIVTDSQGFTNSTSIVVSILPSSIVSNVKQPGSTPGFEIILTICATLFIIFLKKKK